MKTSLISMDHIRSGHHQGILGAARASEADLLMCAAEEGKSWTWWSMLHCTTDTLLFGVDGEVYAKSTSGTRSFGIMIPTRTSLMRSGWNHNIQLNYFHCPVFVYAS